jgi:hypothetical protein
MAGSTAGWKPVAGFYKQYLTGSMQNLAIFARYLLKNQI